MILWTVLTAMAQTPTLDADVFLNQVHAAGHLVRVLDPDASLGGEVVRSDAATLLVGQDPSTLPEDVAWTLEPVPVPDTVLDPTVDPNAAWSARGALTAMQLEPWHAAGARGQGVKVGVLDLSWFGADADPTVLNVDGGAVITGDCWQHPSCEVDLQTWNPRFGFETGVHGYGCAQTVQEMAPEAELHLLRVNGLTTFENAVDYAIRNELDILSMSMSFFNTSFYDGEGPFSRLMHRLAAHDILLVTSAGNYQVQHWAGAWRDGDLDKRADLPVQTPWGPALAVDVGRGTRTLYVQWNEHRTCGLTDIDAIVRDSTGAIVGSSRDNQRQTANSCDPVERIRFEAAQAGIYTLHLTARRTAATGLQLDVYTTGGSIVDGVREGSLTDPAAHPLAFVVGAVDVRGYADNPVESFSSWGPSRGGAAKPDVVGPDGLDSLAFGARGFFGTSASTPAVAGALAVVMSHHPDLSPYEAAAIMRQWAVPQSPTSSAADGPQTNADLGDHHPAYGWGKVRLPGPDTPATPMIGCTQPGRAGGVLGFGLLGLLGWRRARG